jgi:hypothetical protein
MKTELPPSIHKRYAVRWPFASARGGSKAMENEHENKEPDPVSVVQNLMGAVADLASAVVGVQEQIAELKKAAEAQQEMIDKLAAAVAEIQEQR